MNRLRTPERPNLEIAFWDLKQNAVIDAICLWFPPTSASKEAIVNAVRSTITWRSKPT
jgi:hypothetical protein